MTKFRYEVHRVVTKKSGPFEIEADTWLEARVAVMKQFEDISLGSSKWPYFMVVSVIICSKIWFCFPYK